MSEETTLWQGRTSQWTNFWPWLSCITIIGILWAIPRWLKTRSRLYTLTSERLLIEEGILNKATDTLELYRVRDIQITRPFFHRLVGLQNLVLITSDTSTPQVVLPALPVEGDFATKLRAQVEECRKRRGVREIDIE